MPNHSFADGGPEYPDADFEGAIDYSEWEVTSEEGYSGEKLDKMIDEVTKKIKFELKRNFYETLSYMFCLNAIRQEDFLKFIQIPKSKYSKKHCDFKFSSWINGALEFNNKKCEILFNVYICQVMETRLNEKPKNATPHLDGSWVINGEFPPQKQQISESLEKYRVRWRFETNKIVDSDKLEDKNLEIMRNF